MSGITGSKIDIKFSPSLEFSLKVFAPQRWEQHPPAAWGWSCQLAETRGGEEEEREKEADMTGTRFFGSTSQNFGKFTEQDKVNSAKHWV